MPAKQCLILRWHHFLGLGDSFPVSFLRIRSTPLLDRGWRCPADLPVSILAAQALPSGPASSPVRHSHSTFLPRLWVSPRTMSEYLGLRIQSAASRVYAEVLEIAAEPYPMSRENRTQKSKPLQKPLGSPKTPAAIRFQTAAKCFF
jgi:hypothetical protein